MPVKCISAPILFEELCGRIDRMDGIMPACDCLESVFLPAGHPAKGDVQ